MTVYWVGSPKFTSGHPAPLIALVHHRMVGTLRSTDSAFTSADGREASTNFGVGYGCGRAGHPTSAHVHQYVRLGDQAWGNGNWDPRAPGTTATRRPSSTAARSASSTTTTAVGRQATATTSTASPTTTRSGSSRSPIRGRDLLADYPIYARGAMTVQVLRTTVGDKAFFGSSAAGRRATPAGTSAPRGSSGTRGASRGRISTRSSTHGCTRHRSR